jgi:hypothetical protein
MELFHCLLLVIDDADVLDRYTRDYLQYLVQHLPDMGIQIVVFSQERLFPFSEVEHIPALGVDDCQKLLQMTFPDSDFTYISEVRFFKGSQGKPDDHRTDFPGMLSGKDKGNSTLVLIWKRLSMPARFIIRLWRRSV